MKVEAQRTLGGGEPLVDVLLATYNGARYIEAQLESLASQTYPNIRILVSDDGSSDATVSVVQAFARRMAAGWIQWVSNPDPGRGVARNFEALMAASAKDGAARWIAFCDQDDVWLPHKVERLVQAITELECDDGMLPCLVHSDLRVVDESLRTVAASFIRQQRIDVSSMTLPAMLGVNHVTGCATMVNQTLLKLALPLPARVVMHDWWCALLSCQGRRHFLTDPLVLYRQHGGNQVGARSRSIGDRVRRIVCDGPRTMARIRWLGLETLAQAQALQERLHERGLSDLQARDYLRWRRLPVWRRLAGYDKYYKGPMMDNFCRLFLW